MAAFLDSLWQMLARTAPWWGVALAAFWLGALFGTSARERASREALFRQLNGAEKGSKN